MSARHMLVAALLGLMVSAAPAQEFTPNSLLVADIGLDLVYEFKPGGLFVRSFGAGSGLSAPSGLAFGPDGHLYVTSRGNGKVIEFNAAGNKVGELVLNGGAADPVSLQFGPDGHLFVLDALVPALYEFDTNGVEADVVTLDEGVFDRSGMVFGPDGHIFAPDLETDRVLEFDLGGTLIDEFNTGLADPAGLAFGAKGHLFVAAEDTVHELTAGGIVVGSFGNVLDGLEDADGLVVGPNGAHYISSAGPGGGRVVQYDKDGVFVQTFGEEEGLVRPSGIAVAPFRFIATITGTLAQADAKIQKVKEKSAVIQSASGSRTIMITLTDDVTTSADLASIFSSNSIVLRGFEGQQSPQANKRIFHAAQIPRAAFDSGMATMVVSVTGKANSNGVFAPKKLSGTLQRSDGNAVYDAKIRSKKLIK